MTKKINLNKYSEFVDGITSAPSKDLQILFKRMQELENSGANVPRLLTSGIGLPGEAGEYSELVKKILFHGKEYNQENIDKLKKELGDVGWYWMQGCLALNIDPNEIIADNVDKLQSRYPGGIFDAYYAENRQENDR